MLQLAIASVPMQPFRGVYTPAQGWPRGTIFEELDLPFTAVPGGDARPEAEPPCTLDAMRFALVDLRLYLDTHPDSEAARASYRHLAGRIAAEEAAAPGCPDAASWDWAASGLPWEKEDPPYVEL